MNFHATQARRRAFLRLVCLFAVPVLALGLLGAGPSRADARRSTTLHLAALSNADFPQTVTLNDPNQFGEVVYARVSADQAASNVTVTASGSDLTVTPASVHFDTLSSVTPAKFRVDATSPGFHALTFTVTADGAATQTLTLPHIWAGGPHITGSDSLSGRTYGWDGYFTEYGSSTRDTRMLTFIDGNYVYAGLPPQGRPTCSPLQSECKRYYYDSSTGLVQIPKIGVIGEVSGSNLYTDNLLPSDPADTDEFFTGYLMTGTLAYATKGARFSHTWKYASKYDADTFSYQKLTMRSNGSYDLVYGLGTHLKGTYKVLAGGKLVLKGTGRTSNKVVQVGTFLVRTTPGGHPSPGHLGVWLIQSGLKGKTGAGNLLLPTGP